MMTEAERIIHAKDGDQEAIAALYEQSYSKVFYTVRSMIKNEDDAFDILQDSYIKAFSHLDSFEGDAFIPWMRQIAANSARDWLKKKKPLLFSELNAGEDEDIPAEDFFEDERTENLPEQFMEQEETKRLIREILDELPDDQRAAIGMFYYEEMSVKEIAAAMGSNESAVKSRLLYGRRKVEKKVRELEKKGTKLYGLSPILFLLWLFRGQQEKAAENPDPVLLQRVLNDSAADGAAGSMAEAAEMAEGLSPAAEAAGKAGAAAGAVAAAAGGLSAGRLALIAAAAVLIIGGGTFGIRALSKRGKEPAATETVPVETKAPEAESTKETKSSVPAAAESVPPATDEETSAELTTEETTTIEETTAEEETSTAEETTTEEETTLPETTADPQAEAIAKWSAAEEASGRVVLSGSVDTYGYDDVIRLQGSPDPNAAYANKKNTYRIIILDEPKTLSGSQAGESARREVKMICIKSPYSKEPTLPDDFDGQHIIFSVSEAEIFWPGGTDLPLGMPRTSDIHYMKQNLK